MLHCVSIWTPEKQTAYWDKIISHKSILESDFFADILFEKQFQVSDEKNLSAVVVSIKSKVSIHNKGHLEIYNGIS